MGSRLLIKTGRGTMEAAALTLAIMVEEEQQEF